MTRAFHDRTATALADETLRATLRSATHNFSAQRASAVDAVPDFEALRDKGAAVKDDALKNLGALLQQFEAAVQSRGGAVHWARDAAEAQRIVVGICKERGARTAAKSKSMVCEEIELNPALEKAGIAPVETDLGEYIVQLRREPPSHIIAPALHLRKESVAEAFRQTHKRLPKDRPLDTRQTLVREARDELRNTFLNADVGITGANFLLADTGAVVIVSNEGNADLCASLPATHIVVTGIEKVVPTFADASVLLRLLARSATGQPFTAYTSVYAPPGEDSKRSFHVVLVDNGRSRLLGSPLEKTLRCIRCGACLNHCPVYKAIGGHAYGAVYPGPIGAAFSPAIMGLHQTVDIPRASTFCGRCEEVCPVRIPLPDMMRRWREDALEEEAGAWAERLALGAWAYTARHRTVYAFMTRLASAAMRVLARLQERPWVTSLPFVRGWSKHRDIKAPVAAPFQAQWRRKRGGGDDKRA